MSSEECEPDLQYIKRDETKQVDYLRVCIFVFMVLDSTITSQKLFNILEDLDYDEDAEEAAFMTIDKRAPFAQEIVDKYLLKRRT